MQRVEITGSAIKRIDAETSVPVTVLKAEDLKKLGLTTVEQVLGNLASVQTQQGTSQVVGLSTGGAVFADMRGIGANKTLVLLNGRRLANNAFDSSAPDLNMIPFAALERVEVLRDGASSLYGSDAVGGVINFITRKDFRGGAVTVGADNPERTGGRSTSANAAYGWGDLQNDGWNIFAMYDHQQQDRLGGTEREWNRRYAGGLSPTTSPANYFQDGDSANPTAPSCAAGTNLVPDGATGCNMTTSSFVDYIPKSQRDTGMLRGTIKLGENHQLGLEYLQSKSIVQSQIAPVPYGGLFQNRTTPSGALNPFYPGNPGAITPSIPLSPTYTVENMRPGVLPGFINVKWRDLPHGPRADKNINRQKRFVASLTGVVAGWDYNAALTWNENKVNEYLFGYSDGNLVSAGILNGVLNPFGEQTTAGMALIAASALDGNIQNAKGTSKGADFHVSRELGDWFNATRKAGLAIGAQYERQDFLNSANADYAEKVISSTGIDPNLRNAGERTVSALYTELNVPLTSTLDVTAAVRYDRYSDFGNSTNPKFSFRFQPSKALLVRGSYSTGFRAPSLYEINAAQTYTNTSQQDDPVNCPGGTPIPGKPRAANCQQQFQALNGGNLNLDPEKSKNLSFGIVFEPVANLTLGVDLWALHLQDQINELTEETVFGNPTKYASLFNRTASGNLATDGSQCPNPLTCGYVDLRTLNLGDVKTNGVDLSANYRWRTATMGTFTAGANMTYVHRYDYQNEPNGEWIQNVGEFSGTGPIFKWQNHLNLNWARGAVTAGLAAHFKTGYLDQDQGEDVRNRVPSYTTFDLFGGYQLSKELNVTVGARNLFDRDPPLSYQTETFQAGFDPRYSDSIGRTFYVRASYNF